MPVARWVLPTPTGPMKMRPASTFGYSNAKRLATVNARIAPAGSKLGARSKLSSEQPR